MVDGTAVTAIGILTFGRKVGGDALIHNVFWRGLWVAGHAGDEQFFYPMAT
jgi:hypothetical protein